MTLTSIDLWIGKKLFVPPIIKLCQLTRQSQFAVSRLFWFIAALDGFYRAETLLGSILFGGMSIVMMVTASLRARSEEHTSELQSLMRISYAVFCLKKKKTTIWKNIY